MDDADRAKEVEEIPIALAIAAARAEPDPLPACGVCYYCDAIVPPGCRFCDSDCRDDHERLRRVQAINGHRR